MEYLNLTISELSGAEFRRSTLEERGIWLTLMAYCVQQENRGIIAGAQGWSDWDIQAVLGLPSSAIEGSHRLWRFLDGDLEVFGYPLAKQREVQAKRRAGRDGGIRSASSRASSTASTTAATEGKGKEREGKGKEREDVLEAIYLAYPRHVGKADAFKAIRKALYERAPDWLLGRVRAYAAAVATWPADRREFVPYPATWFNGARFDDDVVEWVDKKSSGAAGAPELPFDPTKPDAHTGGIPCLDESAAPAPQEVHP